MADQKSPYESGITHHGERERDAMKVAAEFAKEGIKNCFILNGGAMVAIPAAVALFGIDARAMFVEMMAVAGFLVVGLLAAWGASLSAFFAMSDVADAHAQHRTDWEWSEVALDAALSSKNARYDEAMIAIAEAKSESTRLQNRALRFRLAGIIACLTSVLCFVVGAGYGAHVLINSPAKPASESAASKPRYK